MENNYCYNLEGTYSFYDPEDRESYVYDPELTNKAVECVFG